MRELHGPEREVTLSLFRELDYDLMPVSMVEGYTPGRVFADSATHPTVALAHDRYGSIFVAGAPRGAASADLRDLLAGTIAPDPDRAQGLNWFRIHATGGAWASVLPDLAGDREVTRRPRRLYRMPPGTARPPVPAPPDGYELLPVDSATFARSDLGGREHLEVQVRDCWASVDDYLAHGFGFCAVHASSVVSWCLSEHPSHGRCGLGVETLEEHRGKGLATAVAAACLAEGDRRGETVFWDCSEENEGSIATAARVGFGAHTPHYVHVGAFA